MSAWEICLPLDETENTHVTAHVYVFVYYRDRRENNMVNLFRFLTSIFNFY